jgi:transposase
MQGKKDYQPKLYTTFNLADKIPDNNFYKRLKAVMNLEFIRKETRKYYGKCGQKSLDPVVFIKLCLVGYFENIDSDRQLIEQSSMRMDIRYFLDYDIDEELPWHSTLSRTRQLYGQDVFAKVFKMALKLCIDKGMVGGRRQAIDSALIKANASMDSLREREIMDDADDYCNELCDHEDQGQSSQKSNIKKIEKSDKDSLYGEKNLDNQTYYSPTDPDAKISYKPGKPRKLNYLGQVSVDTNHHVITHIQSDTADKKDSQCLGKVLENTQKNLSSEGLIVEEILCDGNYSSGEVLKNLDEKGISGFIPNFGRYKNKREGFSYHPNQDYYKCSQGKILPFKKIISNSRGKFFREYRSSYKDCKQCVLRTTCIGKSAQKQIIDSIDKPYFDRMHEKMETPHAKYLMKLRQSTVEPVLGTLIEYGGLSKIRTKGIEQADKCMIMAATAYNLKKWMKFVNKKAVSVTNVINENIELLFRLFGIQIHVKGCTISC